MPEDGLVDERLCGFVTVLGDVASPRTALTWLQRGRSRDLLVEMAHGRLPSPTRRWTGRRDRNAGGRTPSSI